MVNGAALNQLPVLSGVPQGSILGPLLFFIYIDDITNLELPEGTQLVLYADILLYRPILSESDFTALQSAVNSIEAYWPPPTS